MALNQVNGSNDFTDQGSATRLFPAQLCSDGLGGYTFELAGHRPPAARLLADAYGGFTIHDGPDNPGALAEMRFMSNVNLSQILAFE